MLATVLKGDLAEQQSIYIMRAFKEMRHYIRRNQQFVTGAEMNLLIARVTEISMQVAGLNDHRIKTNQSIERIHKADLTSDRSVTTIWLPTGHLSLQRDIENNMEYGEEKEKN